MAEDMKQNRSMLLEEPIPMHRQMRPPFIPHSQFATFPQFSMQFPGTPAHFSSPQFVVQPSNQHFISDSDNCRKLFLKPVKGEAVDIPFEQDCSRRGPTPVSNTPFGMISPPQYAYLFSFCPIFSLI